MGIRTSRDRRGKVKLYVDKRWPDGRRLMRVVPNRTVGRKLLVRIEESIIMGTWRELREELSRQNEPEGSNPTMAELARPYLDHCHVKNRRADFKEHALTSIVRILGRVRVGDFRRSHAHKFIEARSKEVKPATINRGLAVIKNMLTFAVDKELIRQNPLLGFPLLPEPHSALRVMTLYEERALVESVAQFEPTIGAYVAILGETGLRKSEGLNLKWHHINAKDRLLTVEETKSGKPRYVPLTEYALSWIASLDRVVGLPYLFVSRLKRPWRDPRVPFCKGREAVGLEWVGLHDMRHFRATQWVKHGVDLRTVQELLGHADIQTTLRYAHFTPKHALRSVHEVEKLEARSIAERKENGMTASG